MCLSGRHSQKHALLANTGCRLVCLRCTALRCEVVASCVLANKGFHLVCLRYTAIRCLADANCVSVWSALTTEIACQHLLPPCLFALHCSSVRGSRSKMSACQQWLPSCLFALHCSSLRGGCKIVCLSGRHSQQQLLAGKGCHRVVLLCNALWC